MSGLSKHEITLPQGATRADIMRQLDGPRDLLKHAAVIEFRVHDDMRVTFECKGAWQVSRSCGAGLKANGTWEPFTANHVGFAGKWYPVGDRFETIDDAWKAFQDSEPRFKVQS